MDDLNNNVLAETASESSVMSSGTEKIKITQNIIFKDSQGEVVVVINEHGKHSFPYRKDDEKCRFINKKAYQECISKLISKENEVIKNNCDFYHVGLLLGYELAFDCNLPHIRYELYKADKILESYKDCEEYIDVIESDKLYYEGVVDALNNAVKIQYDNVYHKQTWNIAIVFNQIIPETDGDTDFALVLPEIGCCKIHIYDELPKETVALNDNQLIMYITPPKTKVPEQEIECVFSNAPVFVIQKKGRFRFSRIYDNVKQVLRKQCSLGAGDEYFRIDPKLVPVLKKYNDLLNDDNTEEVSENKDAFVIEGAKELDMRFDTECYLSVYEFEKNRLLESIKLPNVMKELPAGLFFECSNLDYVALPCELNSIGISAFEGCKLIKKIFMPDTIKEISSRAFYGCRGLKKIHLPADLEYIGSEAFSGCSKLTELHFPPGIVFIAEDAFDNCDSLVKVEAAEGTELPLRITEQVNVKFYARKKRNLRSDT